jgi:hypothetical protein
MKFIVAKILLFQSIIIDQSEYYKPRLIFKIHNPWNSKSRLN